MSGSIQYNPALTTNISNSFSVDSRGFIQGTANDDPTVRNLLRGGPLASTETIPMWGGVAVSNYIPAELQGQLGPVVKRALTNANITGFSVFNQGGNAIIAPGGGVPLFYSGSKVPFYLIGSNARIPLQIDPALVNQDGNLINTQVSWDFTQQRIGVYSPAYAQQTPSAYTGYVSSTGVLSLTFTTAPGVAVGQYVTFAGFTGANIGLNTDMAVLSSASGGTVLTFQAPIGLGSLTLSAGYLVAGGGALNVRIEQIKIGGCKVVTYNPSTGGISWTESGSVALALI